MSKVSGHFHFFNKLNLSSRDCSRLVIKLDTMLAVDFHIKLMDSVSTRLKYHEKIGWKN